MSLSLHRAWPFSATGIFASAALLVSAACHQPQSTAPQPKMVAPSTDAAGGRRFAGVDIVPTTHAGFLVRVHSGMVGELLYVIDGMPMRIQANRGIDWFTPEDIAELKVLKQPHELAEYGADGANGVVVITTKQNPGRRR